MRTLLPVSMLIVLSGLGCSTYTLTPITAADARSDFIPGTTYRVALPNAFLIRSFSPAAFGIGRPGLTLSRWSFPGIGRGAVYQVPAATPVKIERFVRFDQHGLYDCGADGWRFAIASIPQGQLHGKRFLIELDELNIHNREGLVLEPVK